MKNTTEIWKRVEGFEDYEVSNMGRLRSYKKGGVRILKQSPNKKGYPSVKLCNPGIEQPLRVHRLVAQAFIPNPENKPQVNHIDGDKTNNTVYNLEWATNTENIQHAISMGLNTPPKNTPRWGKDNHRSKPVHMIDRNGKLVKTFPAVREASREMKVDSGSVSRCCAGRCKTARGYIWSFDKPLN